MFNGVPLMSSRLLGLSNRRVGYGLLLVILACRGLDHPPCFPLCDQGDETIDHLLVACVFTLQFWFLLLHNVGLQNLSPQPGEDSFDEWW